MRQTNHLDLPVALAYENILMLNIKKLLNIL